MPFVATWMDLETITLSEVSQTEQDRHHMMSYMWNISYISDITYHLYVESKK